MQNLRINALALLALTGVLAGCSGSSEFSDLKSFVEDVKAQPKGAIDPLPEFQQNESFQYSAAGLRAPFSRPIEVKLMKYQQGKSLVDIKPDENRVKEFLEGFSIDGLKMVGTIALGEGKLWALVDDMQGSVHRVRPGNYLGRNHGKVLGVDIGQLDVVEIVPDGHGGWLERPRTLKLQDES